MASNMVLEDAARHGKTDVLANLLKQNPSALADFKLISLSESLLHVATKSGHPNFVRELMKIDPDIARELNKDGFRPLDIAVITGHVAIVKEILSCDRDLCRLKGKDQRTALHYGAIKGRVDVIDELLRYCPEAITDVTVYGETVLHLAAKSYQFDAFVGLVQWIERLGKESIVNLGDGDGNSVLQVAALTKQYACIDLLLNENSTTRATIQVNAKNTDGLTPLDVLDIRDSYDVKIRQTLENAGAITSPNPTSINTQQKSPQYHYHLKQSESEPSKDWFNYFKFKIKRDSPSNTRNALLVVAALIATVCFQSGITPPNGLLEKSPQQPNNRNAVESPPPALNPGVGVGLVTAAAIFGTHATTFLFLFANSLGLTSSTCILIYLTSGFPFQRELHIAMYSMMFTYGFAISAVIKGMQTKNETMAYVLVTAAFIMPFVQRWMPRWGKKAWRHWRRRDSNKTSLPINQN